MRRRRIGLGLLTAFLAAAAVQAAAPDDRAAFEAAKRRALELHAALISKVAPSARAKIAASAQAGRAYLAGCRRSCDLHRFLSADLTARFTRLSQKQLDLLVVLTFAEAVKMGTEVKREAFDARDPSQRSYETLSEMIAKIETTAESIVQNIK